MKEWNGLLKKEWAMMKGWLYGVVISALILMLALGFGMLSFASESVTKSDIIGVSTILWLFVILLLPVATLLTSLVKEWKRPDVWLHSERSIFKLFGSKLFLAALVGVTTLVLPAIVLFVYVVVFRNTVEGLPMSELFMLVGVLFYSFYGVSLLIACVGLFFGVLYQLLKPYVAGFTIPILIVAFGILSMVIQLITATSFYKMVGNFGPIGNMSGEEIYIEKENFYIGATEPIIYTGDMLMTGLAIISLFIGAAMLFEKKVRL